MGWPRTGVRRGSLLISIMLLMAVMPALGRAYVMPAEQLLSFMAANFSEFRSLGVIQTVSVTDKDMENEGLAVEERLWLKAPGFFRREAPGQPSQGVQGPEGRPWAADLRFYRLLLDNDPHAVSALLSGMGIRLEQVALTREDRSVAYRIGEGETGSPRLVMEKARFLPLVLTYRVQLPSEARRVTVRFRDYRPLGKGWYPYEIVVTEGERLRARYAVTRLEPNPLVDPPLESLPGEVSREPHPGPGSAKIPEERRLHPALPALKEKHPRP